VENNIQSIDASKLDKNYFDAFQEKLEKKEDPEKFGETYSFDLFVGGGVPSVADRAPRHGEKDVLTTADILVWLNREIESDTLEINPFQIFCGGVFISGDLLKPLT